VRPQPALPAPTAPAPSPVWAERIERFNHRVILSLLALGLAPDVAREVAQSAWLRLMDKDLRGELDDIRMPGLVIAQARFFGLDELRRQGRERRRRADVDVVVELPDARREPVERLLAREQLERALAELERCPERSRRVFLLLYEEPGLTHAQCAARVGLSVQRVRQIVCEVRTRMRSAITAGEGGAR
jgi:RNA polymerase sigma-70 factor (ECF subfamily)